MGLCCVCLGNGMAATVPGTGQVVVKEVREIEGVRQEEMYS